MFVYLAVWYTLVTPTKPGNVCSRNAGDVRESFVTALPFAFTSLCTVNCECLQLRFFFLSSLTCATTRITVRICSAAVGAIKRALTWSFHSTRKCGKLMLRERTPWRMASNNWFLLRDREIYGKTRRLTRERTSLRKNNFSVLITLAEEVAFNAQVY